jgi:hypothetical protein
LQIDVTQMAALDKAAAEAFLGRSLLHLKQYYPRHCSLLGDAQMRRVIWYGWNKASAYDLAPECCVRSYIDLMCVLGGGFDADPLMPWASALLNDRRNPNAIERGDALYDRAWEYIRAVSRDYSYPDGSPSTSRFVNELKEIREMGDAPLALPALAPFLQGLEAWLRRVLPAKCSVVGEGPIRQVLANAVAGAAQHGIRGERGVTIYAVMLFVLGAGFSRDPLLPWAEACLNDAAAAGEPEKVDRLFVAGVHFLRQWWDQAVPGRG